ncbi:MAG: hypothetical protein WD154_03685 [Nitrosopumilaceae archaeon]
MSEGHYFQWLPLTYSLLIPGILLYNVMTINISFYHWSLIVLAGCLVFLNIALFKTKFTINNTRTEIFRNAIWSLNLIKHIVRVSVTLTVVLGLSLYLLNLYMDVLSVEQTIIQNLNRIFYFWFFSTIISVWLPLILLEIPNYNLIKAYGYFRIGLHGTNTSKKISSYQNGIKSYEKFLSEHFNKKLKHFEEIESQLLSTNTEKIDTEIRSLVNEFDDPLQPARRLDAWIYENDTAIKNATRQNEIFKTKSPYENIEKFSPFVGVIGTIIGIIVTMSLNFIL